MGRRKLEGVLTLKDQLSGQVQRPKQALKDLRGEADGLSRSSRRLNTAMTALATGGLAYIGKEAVSAVWDLGRLGARSKDVSRNLQAFAGGAQQAARFTEAVTEAAGKSINRMDAAATASKLLQMGIATTTADMALYVEGATRLGDQTMSSSQRIGEMTQLLKNLNVNMLDNFGLSRQVVMARTQELQATQGLTREQGMLQAIQEEITRQLEVLGPRAEDGALAVDQLDAAMQNLKITLGEQVAPATIEVSEAIVEGTPKVTDAANQVVTLIEAGLAWAGAAVTGKDATQAFNMTMTGLGNTTARVATVEKDAALATYEAGRASATAAPQVEALGEAFLDAAGAAAAAELKMRSAAGRIAEVYEYRRGQLIDDTESDLDMIERLNRDSAAQIADDADQYAEQMADSWSSAYSDAQAAAQQFDNDVRGLFQFSMNVDTTSIMDRLGFHEDTWDEWMRRAADVMNQGEQSPWFQAMLDAFPKFQELLGKFGDPKAAAAMFIDQFQQGFVPEAVNVEAIVKAYQDKLASEQAWEGIYEQAKAAIRAASGGVDEGILSQVLGGATGQEMLGETRGDVDDLGGAVGGVRGQMQHLGSEAGQALPAITRDTRLARNATKQWHERLQEVIGDYQAILGLGFTVTVTEGSLPGGGGDLGAGGGGGGSDAGAVSTGGGGGGAGGAGGGTGGGVTINSVQVSMDDSFRAGLARVGIHV